MCPTLQTFNAFPRNNNFPSFNGGDKNVNDHPFVVHLLLLFAINSNLIIRIIKSLLPKLSSLKPLISHSNKITLKSKNAKRRQRELINNTLSYCKYNNRKCISRGRYFYFGWILITFNLYTLSLFLSLLQFSSVLYPSVYHSKTQRRTNDNSKRLTTWLL